jgi:hypothetical protein
MANNNLHNLAGFQHLAQHLPNVINISLEGTFLWCSVHPTHSAGTIYAITQIHTRTGTCTGTSSDTGTTTHTHNHKAHTQVHVPAIEYREIENRRVTKVGQTTKCGSSPNWTS